MTARYQSAVIYAAEDLLDHEAADLIILPLSRDRVVCAGSVKEVVQMLILLAKDDGDKS